MPTFALLVWPIVSMVLFSTLGRTKGLIWAVATGYLLLPEAWEFGLPALPDYGKLQAISLGLLLGMMVTRKQAVPLPKADKTVQAAFTVVLLMILAGPLVTMMTNRDVLVFGPRVVQSIGFWDVQSQVITMLIVLVPFFLARRLLHTREAHREMMKALVILAFCYTPLIAFELRMSPQLNNIVYGYFPHAWIQHIRGGGWRPLVFLNHGLELGFFLLTAVLAAAALVRDSAKEGRFLYIAALGMLFLVLAASKNFGAFALAVLFVPAAILLAPRLHRRIGVITALLFVTYPLTREAFAYSVLGVVEGLTERAAGTLAFRLEQEAALVADAFERPLGGWGPWSRWRIFDAETGRDVTVADGAWVIQLGEWGWLGFLGLFGLLIVPILSVRRTGRRAPLTIITSVMILMVAVNLVYLIPNSTLTPVCWLVAGALAGFVQFAPGRDAEPAGAQPAPPDGRGRKPIRYTRFGSETRDRSASGSARSGHPRRTRISDRRT